VSASAFVRDIDNLMRRETTLRQTSIGPRWVSSPVNIGHALTSGIELEAKFPLTDVMADASNIDLRSNYSHFWSHVDGIPGPDNRLGLAQSAFISARTYATFSIKLETKL
jgi:outer membrane receptor for ferrienterochelin and colicins